jgi:hypothetical protein
VEVPLGGYYHRWGTRLGVWSRRQPCQRPSRGGSPAYMLRSLCSHSVLPLNRQKIFIGPPAPSWRAFEEAFGVI